MAFACSRGRGRSQPCGTSGCGGTSVALCDWPLFGSKAGKTCDRRMCEACRTNIGPNKDYCRVHAAMAPTTDSIPIAIVGARNYQALHLVASYVDTLSSKTRVVSGHAKGVDIVAEIAALQRRLETTIFPARGDTPSEFTKAAFARNTKIADVAREADAFVSPTCRGTWDTIQKLRGIGKLVRIHEEPPPAEHALLFHTAVHPNTRQAPKGYRGPSMLDITRGSGGSDGLPFAPSEKLLNEARRFGEIATKNAEALRASAVAQEALAQTSTSFDLQRRADDLEREPFEWYAPRFVEEMRRSWVQHRPAWDALLARNHVVLTCYCATTPSGVLRCHRRILAQLLVKAGGKAGRRVIDGGEVPC